MEFDIQWVDIWQNLIHLGIAYVLALPIGLERESTSRGAGLRTFPLVAVATCGYTLVGMQVLDSTEAESRVIDALIVGIGFIGGGAILKSNGSVSGTATAASIWNTGLVGMAVAFRRYEIAIVMSAINFLTLRFIRELKPDEDTDSKEKS